MDPDARIYVAGHKGMVGSAITRKLGRDVITASASELDLRNQAAVQQFFESQKPDYVFLAAAKVGGILANNEYRGEFLYDNLMIQTNVIEAARITGVKKLLFLGSSCIYPKFAEQPIKEESLLTGALEPTNEPYAIAKISGVKLCQAYVDQYGCNFISAMPTNLYGENDNYDLQSSHVVPALIRKFHEAKLQSNAPVTVWGSGKPRREFLYVDDLADACIFLMENYTDTLPINVGVGEDIAIAELARAIQDVVGHHGEIVFDSSKPDGTPRKLLDVSRLQTLGWRASISLREGLQKAYAHFQTRTRRRK